MDREPARDMMALPRRAEQTTRTCRDLDVGMAKSRGRTAQRERGALSLSKGPLAMRQGTPPKVMLRWTKAWTNTRSDPQGANGLLVPGSFVRSMLVACPPALM